MKEMLHQLVIGFGAIILAPSDTLPIPERRITIPPENATQALGHDRSHVFKDLVQAEVDMNAAQMERLARLGARVRSRQ